MPMIQPGTRQPGGPPNSLWVNVPVPTPVQTQAHRPAAPPAQDQGMPMPPPRRLWAPPPMVLIPHDPQGDVDQGQMLTGQYRRRGRPLRYNLFDTPSSVWLPEGWRPDEELAAAHEALQHAYGNPTPETFGAYYKAATKAIPLMAHNQPAWLAASEEAEFARKIHRHMEQHKLPGMPADQVAFLRGIRQAGPGDHAPYLQYADWVEEHGDPLAAKVAAHMRTHTYLADNIRRGGRLNPKLLAAFQEHQAGEGSPLFGPRSYGPGEHEAMRRRFATSVLNSPIARAMDERRGAGLPAYNLDRLRRNAETRALRAVPTPELTARHAALPPDDFHRNQVQAELERRMISRGREGAEPPLGRPPPKLPPVHFRRPGRARRYMMSDIQGLHAGLAEKPHDAAVWGMLADAMQDQGLDTAHAVRTMMSGKPKQFDLPGKQKARFVVADPGGYGNLRSLLSERPLYGHVAGVPMTVIPGTGYAADYHGPGGRRPAGGPVHHTRLMDFYHLLVHAPTQGQPTGGSSVGPSHFLGHAFLNRKQAADVMREMAPIGPQAETWLPMWRDRTVAHLGARGHDFLHGLFQNRLSRLTGMGQSPEDMAFNAARRAEEPGERPPPPPPQARRPRRPRRPPPTRMVRPGAAARYALEGMYGWLTPEGRLVPTEGMTHQRWMRQRGPFPSEDDAFRAGWHRLTFGGGTLFAHNDHLPPNRAQREYLETQAIENRMQRIVHATGPEGKAQRVLWGDRHEFRRPGRPARYTADVEGLHLGISSVPKNGHGGPADLGAWGMMQDALAEAGKPGAAELAGLISKPTTYGTYTVGSGRHALQTLTHIPRYDPQQTGDWDAAEDGDAQMSIGGLPVVVTRYRPFTGEGPDWFLPHPSRPEFFEAHVIRHNAGDAPGAGRVGSAVIPAEHVGRLLDEADRYYGQVPYWHDVEDTRSKPQRATQGQPPHPEHFGLWRAPAGGMVTRGIYQTGGRFQPPEAGGQTPPFGRARGLLARWRARRRMRRGAGAFPAPGPGPYQAPAAGFPGVA